MAEITRRIGLSLGADICWPLCYQAIMKRLNLKIKEGGDTIRFEVERMGITPFDLREHVPFDLVIDRLTHWYNPRREWIKKAMILDDVYVFNNPWSVQSMEKLTTYAAMMRLGFPIPRTWLIPPKEYDPQADLQVTLERYAEFFDLSQIGETLGYPLFMKPYDGGGWKGVTRIDDQDALTEAYDRSGKLVMHLQEAVDPFETYVRCVGLGPQTRLVSYEPAAPLHDRYTRETGFLTAPDAELIRKMTLVINAFFGWDFNSCEVLLKQGTWHPIDFANPCPDSQVTSLHYHFPWLIKANVRWSVFAAATKKPQGHLTWRRYFKLVEKDLPFSEQLDRYMRIVHHSFQTERFLEFCDAHLAHLDEVADDFFGSQEAKDAVRLKVEALYPAHEVDEFTEMFWQRIQDWRQAESSGDSLDLAVG
ncbi:MAG: ATP-grasp domain-containing protein [Longimicrobiales bacterium]